MKKPKNSLQEHILRFLSGKKAHRQTEVIEHIEAVLGSENDTKAKYAANRALKKMIEDDAIISHDTEHSSFLSLTPSGRQKLRNIRLSSENHLVSTQWDGYWRMVIVDIPDSRKKDQDAIRYILKKAQFTQIKNSIWISPYPLEHMMINMKRDMGLEQEIMVLVTDKLDAMTERILIAKFEEKKGS